MHDVIQIAGIHDLAEAELLVEEGVEWLGFPLRLPVHREDISEDDAARVIRAIQPRAKCVLITYLHTADAILTLCRKLDVTMVQLHGDIPIREIERIRLFCPEMVFIKSLVVRTGNLEALKQLVERFAPHVEGFITDTYDPATGACGATGKTHDWSVSRQLVRLSPKPVILAGGLNPLNVAAGIHEVQPAGVDAHTGVENPDGRKNREKVRAFVTASRAAFAAIGPPKRF